MSEKLIQSYVKEQFFVSTIHRKSSTMPSMWFYETMAWEWDKGNRHRGELISQDDSGISEDLALDDHMLICLNLLKEIENAS